jgi:hypothetical protein
VPGSCATITTSTRLAWERRRPLRRVRAHSSLRAPRVLHHTASSSQCTSRTQQNTVVGKYLGRREARRRGCGAAMDPAERLIELLEGTRRRTDGEGPAVQPLVAYHDFILANKVSFFFSSLFFLSSDISLLMLPTHGSPLHPPQAGLIHRCVVAH